MPSPAPDATTLRIIGKLLENPAQLALVAIVIGAFVLVVLFAGATWGVRIWNAYKGRNGHIVVAEGPEPGAREPTIPPGGLRVEDIFPPMNAREMGKLEGQIQSLAAGHKSLREDLNKLTGQVAVLTDRTATMPNDTAELCIQKLLDRGVIKDARQAPRHVLAEDTKA